MSDAAGAGADADVGGAPRSVTVRILGLPLALWAEAGEHVDGLLREFALLVGGDRRHGAAHVPRRLLDLVEEVQRDYAAATSGQRQQLAAAVAEGHDRLDLSYEVPPEIAEACRRLDDALDAADSFCREGRYLLSLATPPAALAFRRWYLGEFVRQVAGTPPRTWEEWRRASG